MPVETSLTVLWVVWYVTWIAAVVWSARTRVQLKSDMRAIPRLLFSAGLVLAIFAPDDGLWLGPASAKVWLAADWVQWCLFGLVAACFAFCWWARLHLGRLWSGFVTLKEGHRIVDTGPYAIVRHPIYSAIILASLLTALLRATPAAFAGFALVAAGLTMISRIEESFLRGQLGDDAYDAYSRRVPMLVPLIG